MHVQRQHVVKERVAYHLVYSIMPANIFPHREQIAFQVEQPRRVDATCLREHGLLCAQLAVEGIQSIQAHRALARSLLDPRGNLLDAGLAA